MAGPVEPMAGIELRAIGAFDFDLLARMHATGFTAGWDRPWSRQSFAEILVLPGSSGLVAVSTGAPQQLEEPVGFCLTLSAGEEVELLLLTVLPPWRKRGIARRLLLQQLCHAWRGGATRALLEVADTNTDAIACYEKAGFTPCGRRRNYYATGVDALIYERFLTADNIQAHSDS